MPASINSAISPYQSHVAQTRVTPEHAGALFWNGLFGVRWEEAPLGAEAIGLTVRLRERGYAGRTCRDYGHAVVHLGRFLHEERGSDQVRDDEVVTDFLGGHLPGCRCYRCLVGREKNRSAGDWRISW